MHLAKRVATRAMAVALVREIMVELSKPGTGRLYKRASWKRDGSRSMTKGGAKRYRAHRASAPGQPPAVDHGTLRSSIGMETEDTRGSVRVGSGLATAPILELEMNRPFMSTAVKRVERVFNRIITGVLRGAAGGWR